MTGATSATGARSRDQRARPSGRDFLQATYTALGLTEGRLLAPAESPARIPGDSWLALGDWLSMASRMGADRLLFVGNDPVLVFAAVPASDHEAALVRAYRQAWSLGRPKCLFLATPTELRVYDLAEPPPANIDEWRRRRPLRVVQRVLDIRETLEDFTLESIESGASFGGSLENSASNRARRERSGLDAQLVSDVQGAAELLHEQGLTYARAHSLIQRAILVRYLEDREVLTPDYFQDISPIEPSEQQDEWRTTLGATSYFAELLQDETAAYSLFRKLSQEFNGDLFHVDEEERAEVTQAHLDLLRRMLLGDIGEQRRLFLWAYDFSVVPISLISSIYEHFYQQSLEDGDDDGRGTHYTPPELVEFTLERTLTPAVLASSPRVLDPACGSGVFLVEAFRTIVRYEAVRLGRRLRATELKRLLLTRVAGIDINSDAVRLAAFSLYLAYLNYQSPQDIRRTAPLPRLIHKPQVQETGILVANDAFTPLSSDDIQLEIATERAPLPWPAQSFDVVVGNPPWDRITGSQQLYAEQWAAHHGLPVGQRSLTQLFLWRSLSLLRPGGICGLLISAMVVFGDESTTKRFKAAWLQSVSLREVVNFSAARRLFFANAVAPFMLVVFRNEKAWDVPVVFETVRPTSALRRTGSVSYARMDRRYVSQDSLVRRDYLWKVYSWGSHRDDALMARLDLEKKLSDFFSREARPGYGFQFADRRGGREPSETLRTLPCLKTFRPWGDLRPSDFEAQPVMVKRDPNPRIYFGRRLLVRRGVEAGYGPLTRFVEEPLSFRHTIYSIPLGHLSSRDARIIAGIAMSQLGRYRIFMMSGTWGAWFDQTVTEDIHVIPVRLPSEDDPRGTDIVEAVEALLRWRPLDELHLGENTGSLPPPELREQLDRAVNDLFDLSLAERDLLQDWEANRLPLTQGTSRADELVMHALTAAGSDPSESAEAGALSDYVDLLVRSWNEDLAPGGKMSWKVIPDPAGAAVAVVLETRSVDDAGMEDFDDVHEWSAAMARAGRQLVSTGVARIVGETYVVLLKPAERRHWSRAAAREDYEATVLQAMNLADGSDGAAAAI